MYMVCLLTNTIQNSTGNCQRRRRFLWPHLVWSWPFDLISPKIAEPRMIHTNKYKNAFLENIFCDLGLWVHDLQNLISLCPEYVKSFVWGFVEISLLVRELPHSQGFFGHHWLTLTFEPMALSISSVYSALANDYCDHFH